MKLKGQTRLISFHLLILLLFLDIVFSLMMNLRIRLRIRRESSGFISSVAQMSVSCSFLMLLVMSGLVSV